MADAARSVRSPEHLRDQAIAALLRDQAIAALLRDQAIAALVPFFVDGLATDELAARAVAVCLLDSCDASAPKELQLSAQIIAFGWAALACLSAAIVVKDGPLEQMLPLRDAASTLDRAWRKAVRALEAHRRERAENPPAPEVEPTRWDAEAFRSAINQASVKMREASARLTAFLASAPVKPQRKLSWVSGEPMTRVVLDRRRRHALREM